VDNTPDPAWTQQEPEAEQPILFRVHAFAYACEQHAIEHRRTQPKHPWTNGQVERMNRTLKEATVKRYYYYQTHQQLKEHLQTFLMAYNFARRLKTLRGLTHTSSSANPGRNRLFGLPSTPSITPWD
jgi:transposase InsO family protein